MPRKPTTKDIKTEINLLHQIIEIFGLSENLDTLLHQIARVLANSLKGDSCLIYLLGHDSPGLTLSGAWPPHPYQVGKLRLEPGEGLTGWVATHKKLVALPKNAYKDSRFKVFQNLPEDRYEAFLSVPILLGGELIGVINLQNRKPRAFTPNLVKLLTSTASQVAGAIEKTRLMQLAERKAKQLETITRLSSSIVSKAYIHEILQLIVTMTAQMMNSKICSLMLLDQEKQELTITATQSLSEEYRKKPALRVGASISGKALEQRKPIAVLNVTSTPGYGYPEIARKEGLRSMLAVPMFFQDKTIGVLNCYTAKEHVFTEEEISILQAIANQSAVAIENTRLLKEAHDAREALETRKVIERAKGIIMKNQRLNEEAAFQFLQKQAMNHRRTMREIAEAILLTEGLKSK
ncbi:MAG: GAF domain-containing protein [Endomicrobiales bacterium]